MVDASACHTEAEVSPEVVAAEEIKAMKLEFARVTAQMAQAIQEGNMEKKTSMLEAMRSLSQDIAEMQNAQQLFMSNDIEHNSKVSTVKAPSNLPKF